MITHVFKGNSDIFGTFAYMENDELVVGENVLEHSGYIYRGSLEDFRNSRDYLKLAARNRPLLDDINDYYNLWKHDKKNQEDTLMKDVVEKVEAASAAVWNGLTNGRITNKLCEIKVTEGADSFKELVYQLTANGYRVDAAPVYKEFPKTGLDYWMIAIFDKEEKK